MGLLVNGAVTGVITRVYKVTKFQPHDITVYVNTDNVGWSSLNFWTWGGDETHGPMNPAWPGDKITATTVIDGKTWYYNTYRMNSSTDYVNFVFSTGSGSPQTVDVVNVKTDKFYEISTTMSGGKHTVDDVTGQHSTGIGTITAENAGKQANMNVYTLDGRLVRRCAKGTSMDEALDGLPRGMYIAGGKKAVKR